MKGKKRIKQYQQSNILQLLMFRYFPYWPLFVVLSVICLAVAFFYLQVATPLYEVKATLLIKDEKKGVENSQVVESLNILESKKIVENEIEVIRSRTLMRETMKKLHLYAPVYEDGLLFQYSAYTTSPVIVEVKDINELSEAARVDFTYYPTSKTVLFEDEERPLLEWIHSPFGTLRFVENPHLTSPGIGPFFVSIVDPRNVVDELMLELNVLSSNKLASIVVLSLRDAVPERGENILNTLIESYNLAAIEDKNSLADTTLEFVEARIREVENDLDSLERSIQQYKSARGIVDLSEQGKVFLNNVGDNDQRLSELDMQLAILDFVEDYVVQTDSTARIVPSTIGVNDPRLSAMIQRLYEAEVRYSGLKKTTAENNPILMSLKSEIEDMRPGILENIRNQKTSLVASRAKLSTTNDKYAYALTTIPQKERELLEANRQQSIKNNVYTFLLQKKEETILSVGATSGGSRLVDKAESSLYPVAPKKLFVYGAALAFAFLLGVVWVTKKEVLNNHVLFRSEIEEVTSIPIVAEIADSEMKNIVVIDNLKKPFLTEQFIQLKAAIGCSATGNKRVLMVTSSIGGEGKSFISTNFAISLAGSQKKVLLIDMDLRNPRLSYLFNVANVAGVSDYLHGEMPVQQGIRRTRTHNLFLMGAGKKRAKATELLIEQNLEHLFETLRGMFDYIVVDTPPMTPVIDASLISPYCDATLFVVRHGKTPKKLLQFLDESEKIKSLKNSSIVFNGIKPRGLIKNNYGYGYGYSYQYEYGEGRD